MFVVQVAADIFNNKVNFELSFPSRPTILEVTRASESAFSNEIASRRAENIPPHNFHLAKAKIYDEDKNKWVDLTTEGQLFDYCQLYAFQPENPWHKESQKEIPAAAKPPSASAAGTRYAGGNTSATRGAGNGALAPYTAARRASHPAHPSAALVPKASADATLEEKLRVLFAEFDGKGSRALELDDLKSGFRTFQLDLSAATVEDLFDKTDMNRDGRISFSEFERLGRLYPIMTDCLFFRSKAFWEEEQMRREVEAARAAVRAGEAAVEETRRAVFGATADVDAAVSAVSAAEADVKDRADRLRDLTADVERARRDRERALREKKEREKAAHAARDREAEGRAAALEQSREAERLDRRQAASLAECGAAEEKVRQLEKALEEARRAAERARAAAEQSARDGELGRQRARDVLKEAEAAARETAEAEEAVRGAERAVLAAEECAKGLEAVGRDLARDAEEAARRRDQSEKAVEGARDRVRERERQLEEAKRLVEEREGAAREREEELAEQRKQRELVSQHERALVEQELRLREQRDSLEERETKLMSEATSFLGNLRTKLRGKSHPHD